MRKVENIFWLGIKELRSFLHDFVLLGFVIYAFSHKIDQVVFVNQPVFDKSMTRCNHGSEHYFIEPL